jgi:flagella basal body P-ring formation protein FlgA
MNRLIASITLALLATAARGASAPAAAAEPRAEQVLRTQLTRAYPEVSEWNIVPLPSTAARAIPQLSREAATVVERVGVRSAVWVGSDADRSSGHGEWLWFAVAGIGPAMLATHALGPGVELAAGDGSPGQGDLVAAGCRPVASPQALEGMRTRVSVSAGSVICASAIEPRPPIVRGQEVTVLYLGTAVSLTSHAVAQADGLLGHAIWVRSTESGELFKATVSGPAEVRVHD